MFWKIVSDSTQKAQDREMAEDESNKVEGLDRKQPNESALTLGQQKVLSVLRHTELARPVLISLVTALRKTLENAHNSIISSNTGAQQEAFERVIGHIQDAELYLNQVIPGKWVIEYKGAVNKAWFSLHEACVKYEVIGKELLHEKEIGAYKQWELARRLLMATNTLFFRLKIQNLDKSLINTLRKRLQIFLGFMNHISRERLKGVVVLVEEAASYYEQKDFLAVSHKLQEAFRLMEKLYEQSSDDDRFQYSLRSFMMECCLLMIVCLEEDRLSKEAADHSLWSANNKVFREGKVIAKVRTDGTIEGDISNPDVANALADVLLMKALRVDSICGRSNDSLPGNRSLITD